ncbi:MAG: hypothetical protein V8T39_07925 [Streptococcus lutetiensis]|uniref:hypothetical protein n=1 Tax=Streptococcus lutetiensis TaxID=150055 RepID=UPI0020016860|nr:hypothetical protein [Streptococcus lutetiensis]
MANKNKNKIFLIFVEGTTDEDCLEPLREYYENKINPANANIDIRVKNGDIFTDVINKQKSGKDILKEQIQNYLNYSKLKPQDIVHVAFITDTDGIYVNNYTINRQIDEEFQKDGFQYDLENKTIVCKNNQKKESIQRSRQTKARKISDILKSPDKIFIQRAPIPYSVYYNSLNLEHVLFNKIIPGEKKTETLDEFLDKIDESPDKLIQIFSEKALSNDYQTSWSEIQNKEMNQGYSNINLLFKLILTMADKK